MFGCLALECAIYPVYRISLIVIWRCDLMILIWWPHDLKKGGEKRNREVNKSNSGAAEHESRMLTVRKCVSMARKTAVRQCESGWGNVGLGEYGKYKGV